MLNYDSIYKQYSGTSVEWVPMDDEDLYKKNLNKHRSLLEQNNWIDRKVTYTFNSNGFRSNEFTDDSTVMFLGCSITTGIGVPSDDIWPTLVAKQLGMACANLGQAGGSPDTAFRLCLGWIDKIRPKMVIFLRPPGIRWELVHSRKITFLGVWSSAVKSKYKSYMNDYWADENNYHFNLQKNILALQQLCEQRKIKFNEFNHLPAYIDLARDLFHPGAKTHQLLADRILDAM